MVRSEIIFFDTTRNSMLGTGRAVISFFPMLIIFALLVNGVVNGVEKWCGIILASLVLSSAIGVQLPKTYYQAGLYGLLVGVVVGSCITAVEMITPKETFPLIWAIIALPIITGLLSLLTFAISSRVNLYPVYEQDVGE